MAFCSYLPIAALAYWPVWVHWSSSLNGCNCWDQVQQQWFVQWVQSALGHGHSVLYTNAIYVPGGINLMWNASVIALGFLFSPLTATIGVVHTFSILLTASFAFSATTTFVVLRRWTKWGPSAWIGGLVYGFSSLAVVEASTGRLNLVFIGVMPLLVLALDKLICHEWSAVQGGVIFGLLLTAQLFISEELLLIFVVVAGLTLVALAAVHRAAVWHERMRVIYAAVSAAIVFVVICAYPLYVQFTGPAKITGPPQPRATIAAYSSDTLSLITPGAAQWIDSGWTSRIYDHFTAVLGTEVTTYVGIPLLLLVLATAILLRRERVVRIFSFVALVSFVLSMGPTLMFNGHKLGLPLPEDILSKLPVVGDIIPSRYAVGMWLGVAIVLGVGLDHLRISLENLVGRWAISRSPAHAKGGIDLRPLLGGTLAVVVAFACLIPMIPQWPYPQVPAAVPTFFTSSDALAIPPDSVVATYPYPLTATAWPMVWQADTDMRFRMLGGYAIGPDPTGAGTYFSSPNSLEYCFLVIYSSRSAKYCDPTQFRETLQSLNVTSVVVGNAQTNARLARSTVTSALGAPPRRVGGISLWRCVGASRAHRCHWE